MKREAEGSVVLIVFVTLTIVVVWATTLLRSTIFMNDVVLAKQKYEQQFRLTEGLLEYGIGAAKLLYKRWQHESTSLAVCTFDQWPPLGKNSLLSGIGSYSGKVTFQKKEKEMKIHAQLLAQARVIMGLNCIVQEVNQELPDSSHNNQSHLFTVTAWAFDE